MKFQMFKELPTFINGIKQKIVKIYEICERK